MSMKQTAQAHITGNPGVEPTPAQLRKQRLHEAMLQRDTHAPQGCHSHRQQGARKAG